MTWYDMMWPGLTLCDMTWPDMVGPDMHDVLWYDNVFWTDMTQCELMVDDKWYLNAGRTGKLQLPRTWKNLTNILLSKRSQTLWSAYCSIHTKLRNRLYEPVWWEVSTVISWPVAGQGCRGTWCCWSFSTSWFGWWLYVVFIWGLIM